MKQHFFLSAALFASLSGTAFSQARLTLSDGAFAVIAGGAKLVVDNPAPNAIQTLGAGGKIISEGESSGVKWNIGAATGAYVFPFTTMPIAQGGDEVAIPLSIAITTPGSAGGSLMVSTYKTDNLNQPYPTGVANMYSSVQNGDGSLFAIDRFWIIDAQSYTTQPDATISMGYNDGAAETGGSNVFAENTLKAQRWNDVANTWGGGQFGTGNTTTNTVDNIVVPSGSFHSVWTLVSSASPLPVQLVAFDARADGAKARLDWEVAHAADVARYDVERSADGQSFNRVGQVAGSALRGHIWYDGAPLEGISYYRIRIAGTDGSESLSAVRPVAFSKGGAQQLALYPTPASDALHLDLAAGPDADASVMIADLAGKVVLRQPCAAQRQTLDVAALPAGVYVLRYQDGRGAILRKFEKL